MTELDEIEQREMGFNEEEFYSRPLGFLGTKKLFDVSNEILHVSRQGL